MFSILTLLHSAIRWLVLASLLYAIIIAARGYFTQKPFVSKDNLVRHWTATIGHIQLLLGILMVTQSPTVRIFWNGTTEAEKDGDILFFGLLHPSLMLISIVVLTVGSALAKRCNDDHQKFRTMLVYFSVALLLILIAIPWPFSPLASRPYFR